MKSVRAMGLAFIAVVGAVMLLGMAWQHSTSPRPQSTIDIPR